MTDPRCSLPVCIRPATVSDIEAITSIYGHHVQYGTASFETEPPNIDEMAKRQASLLAQGYPYFVAEQIASIVGYAYASTYRPRAAYRDTVENSVYLRPDRIGRGVGSMLLAALIEASRRGAFGK